MAHWAGALIVLSLAIDPAARGPGVPKLRLLNPLRLGKIYFPDDAPDPNPFVPGYTSGVFLLLRKKLRHHLSHLVPHLQAPSKPTQLSETEAMLRNRQSSNPFASKREHCIRNRRKDRRQRRLTYYSHVNGNIRFWNTKQVRYGCTSWRWELACGPDLHLAVFVVRRAVLRFHRRVGDERKA